MLEFYVLMALVAISDHFMNVSDLKKVFNFCTCTFTCTRGINLLNHFVFLMILKDLISPQKSSSMFFKDYFSQ